MKEIQPHKRLDVSRRGGLAGGRKRAFTGSLNRTHGDGPEADDLGTDDLVPYAKREPADEPERRWVVRQSITGDVTVEVLRGKVAGNLTKRAAICDSQQEAEEKAKEWRA